MRAQGYYRRLRESPENYTRKLLETTDMLLSDIAQECGFYDQSHMTKAFKTIRKTTPGEYRRRHRAISST